MVRHLLGRLLRLGFQILLSSLTLGNTYEIGAGNIQLVDIMVPCTNGRLRDSEPEEAVLKPRGLAHGGCCYTIGLTGARLGGEQKGGLGVAGS